MDTMSLSTCTFYIIYSVYFLILTSPCVCFILTPWVYDSQHTHVVPLYLLVSGTKYSPTLFLSITFLNIIFDWDDFHYQVSKHLKYTALCRLGHEISYHVICRAPLYIQFLLNDTCSDEKEMNFGVLCSLAS